MKSEARRGLFLDSRVKKSGGRSRAKGEKSEDFRITNNDGGGTTALLHCEDATKDF